MSPTPDKRGRESLVPKQLTEKFRVRSRSEMPIIAVKPFQDLQIQLPGITSDIGRCLQRVFGAFGLVDCVVEVLDENVIVVLIVEEDVLI